MHLKINTKEDLYLQSTRRQDYLTSLEVWYNGLIRSAVSHTSFRQESG